MDHELDLAVQFFHFLRYVHWFRALSHCGANVRLALNRRYIGVQLFIESTSQSIFQLLKQEPMLFLLSLFLFDNSSLNKLDIDS